jgi:hypothetical protein
VHVGGDVYHGGDIKHLGSTSGTLTLKAAAVTTDHTLTLPDTVGTAGQLLAIDPNGAPGDLKWMEHFNSTGVISGGVLSVGTPDTTYSITDGHGHISNNGVLSEATWSGLTNISITDPAPPQPGGTPSSSLASRILSYVSIDSNGLSVVSAERPNYAKQREYIFLGVLVHVNGVNINTVNNQQSVLENSTNGFRDLCDILGFINVSGNTVGYTGTDKITKTDGSMFAFGANYNTDINNPHVVTLPAIDTSSGGTFQIRFQDGSSSLLTLTSFQVDMLDDGTPYPGTTLTNNYYAVWRAYSFTSNALKFQAPQFEYSSESAAIANINVEGYVKEPSLNNGILIGYVVVREGNDLTTASFLSAPTLGGGGVSGGSSIPSMQTVYDASVSPQLVLTSALGALSIQDAATPTGGTLFEVNDNGGSAVLDVTSSTVTVSGTLANNNIVSSGAGTELEIGGNLSTGNVAIAPNVTTGKVSLCGTFSGGGPYGLFSVSGGDTLTMGVYKAGSFCNFNLSANSTAEFNMGSNASSGTYNAGSSQTSGTVSLGKKVTTGAINIGESQTSADISIGNTAATTGKILLKSPTVDVDDKLVVDTVNASGVGTTMNLANTSTTGNVNIAPAQTTGIVTIGNANASSGGSAVIIESKLIRIGDNLAGRATSTAPGTGEIVTVLKTNNSPHLEIFHHNTGQGVNLMAVDGAGGDADMVLRGTSGSDFYFGASVNSGLIAIGTAINTGTIDIGTSQTTGDITLGNINSTTGDTFVRGANWNAGSYTPTIGDGTNNFTGVTAKVNWRRMMNMLHVVGKVAWTGKGSASAALPVQIGGFPFTTLNDSGTPIQTLEWGNNANNTITRANYNIPSIYMDYNSSTMQCYIETYASGGNTQNIMACGDLGTAGSFTFNGWIQIV